MKSVNVIVSLSAVLVFAFSSPCSAGVLTYQFLQDGNLVSGEDSIETDGHLGTLSPGDVLGCTWFSPFDNNSGTPIYSSSALFAGITATQTELVLSDPGYFEVSGGSCYGAGFAIVPCTLAIDYGYAQLFPISFSVPAGFEVIYAGSSDGANYSEHNYADPPTPLVIAEVVTTPEPGTLPLLAAAGVGLLGCAWRRRGRRRSQAQPACWNDSARALLTFPSPAVRRMTGARRAA